MLKSLYTEQDDAWWIQECKIDMEMGLNGMRDIKGRTRQ